MNSKSVLLISTLAILASAPVAAEDKGAAAVAPQVLKAKTDYCKTCHGLDGQGFRGSFPMPRLAGQQPEYLANQLQAFIDRRRTNPVMFNVAHVLDPAMDKANPDTSAIMQPIAHDLTDAQIKAVAAYVSQLD